MSKEVEGETELLTAAEKEGQKMKGYAPELEPIVAEQLAALIADALLARTTVANPVSQSGDVRARAERAAEKIFGMDDNVSCTEAVENMADIIAAEFNPVSQVEKRQSKSVIKRLAAQKAAPVGSVVHLQDTQRATWALSKEASGTDDMAIKSLHRCPHFKPKGEDSGGAYNAQIIIDVSDELLDRGVKEMMAKRPTSWYSMLIKQLIQRIANAVSLPVFIESFPPDSLLFLPAPPKAVLSRAADGYVYVAGESYPSGHACSSYGSPSFSREGEAMNMFGVPGIGGSLGKCAVCGEPFLLEILTGDRIKTFYVDGINDGLCAHKKCMETLAKCSGEKWRDLPIASPLRKAFITANAEDKQ